MLRKAVIAVAGSGTRMNPITKIIAKELLPIGVKPVLDFIVDECISSGVTEILFIINQKKLAIPAYYSGVVPEDYSIHQTSYPLLGHSGVTAAYVFQNEPKGTGDAVMRARSFTNGEPFALCYGDDIISAKVPAIRQLANYSISYNNSIVMAVQRYPAEEAALYATVECERFDGVGGKVVELVEKMNANEIKSDLTSIGRYILNEDIFEYITKVQQRNGEYYLTDALELMAKQKEVYACLVQGTRYDTGNPKGYIETFKALS